MEQNDHDLLVSIANDVKRMVKAIDGNGQPGIASKVAVLEQDMLERQTEARDLRIKVQDKNRNAVLIGGLVTAVMIPLFEAAKQVFGS